MSWRLLIIFSLLSCGITSAQEKSSWSLDVHGGAPFNFNLPLTIKQTGYPDIKLNAQYYSEPFKMPIFWVFRISKWKNNKAWEIEMMHQKLYLKNTPPEVQYFNITHGFNQIIVSRSVKFNFLKKHEFIYKGGAGIVLAHAENKIRNKELNQQQSFFNWGYYVAGPSFNISLAKQLPLNKRLYFNAETKFNISYANVPIVEGHALVWHSAVELIFGLGYYFIKK
jgi:hypothetical protein